jgi:hypothetical protein
VKVGFANLTNIVTERWKKVDPEYKKKLGRMAFVHKKKVR